MRKIPVNVLPPPTHTNTHTVTHTHTHTHTHKHTFADASTAALLAMVMLTPVLAHSMPLTFEALGALLFMLAHLAAVAIFALDLSYPMLAHAKAALFARLALPPMDADASTRAFSAQVTAPHVLAETFRDCTAVLAQAFLSPMFANHRAGSWQQRRVRRQSLMTSK